MNFRKQESLCKLYCDYIIIVVIQLLVYIPIMIMFIYLYNNKTFLIHAGTHGVQDINITVHGKHVCVTCILADWATTNTCRVVLYSETTLTVKSLALSTELSASTLTNCTEGIPRGHYHVKAYGGTTTIVSNHAVMRYLYLDVAAPKGSKHSNWN